MTKMTFMGEDKLDFHVRHLTRKDLQGKIYPYLNRISFLCTRGEGNIYINLDKKRVEAQTWINVNNVRLRFDELSEDFEGYVVAHGYLQNAELFRYLAPYFFFILESPVQKLDDNDYRYLKKFYELILERKEHQPVETADDIDVYNKTMATALVVEMRNIYKRLTQKDDRKLAKSAVSYNRPTQIAIKFLELMSTHYIEHRTIQHYAALMCLSPKHLTSSVKTVTTKTPSYFINSLIMLEAKQRLMTSGKSVQEIADDLNFPNASFFGKFFKKHSGVSPNAYRNSQTKNLF